MTQETRTAARLRFLVALDGSRRDDAVLDRIERLARNARLEIVLLQVAHYHTRDSRTVELARSRVILDRAGERLSTRGLRARAVVGQGEVAETIVKQAIEQGADLIVMAARGHGALRRALERSLPDQVRHTSAVPVLLVR